MLNSKQIVSVVRASVINGSRRLRRFGTRVIESVQASARKVIGFDEAVENATIEYAVAVERLCDELESVREQMRELDTRMDDVSGGVDDANSGVEELQRQYEDIGDAQWRHTVNARLDDIEKLQKAKDEEDDVQADVDQIKNVLEEIHDVINKGILVC